MPAGVYSSFLCAKCPEFQGDCGLSKSGIVVLSNVLGIVLLPKLLNLSTAIKEE
jgi:hypothetical protein